VFKVRQFDWFFDRNKVAGLLQRNYFAMILVGDGFAWNVRGMGWNLFGGTLWEEVAPGIKDRGKYLCYGMIAFPNPNIEIGPAGI